MAKRSHPFPYRTRKLSSLAPMVVGGSPPVRVGRCQAKPLLLPIRGFYFVNFIENYLNGPLVKRLRHRPFTAVTRVRIPYGSPLMFIYIFCGGLAQLGEHLPYKQGVGGSIPSSSTIDYLSQRLHAGVAQLVEQLTCNQ